MSTSDIVTAFTASFLRGGVAALVGAATCRLGRSAAIALRESLPEAHRNRVRAYTGFFARRRELPAVSDAIRRFMRRASQGARRARDRTLALGWPRRTVFDFNEDITGVFVSAVLAWCPEKAPLLAMAGTGFNATFKTIVATVPPVTDDYRSYEFARATWAFGNTNQALWHIADLMESLNPGRHVVYNPFEVDATISHVSGGSDPTEDSARSKKKIYLTVRWGTDLPMVTSVTVVSGDKARRVRLPEALGALMFMPKQPDGKNSVLLFSGSPFHELPSSLKFVSGRPTLHASNCQLGDIDTGILSAFESAVLSFNHLGGYFAPPRGSHFSKINMEGNPPGLMFNQNGCTIGELVLPIGEHSTNMVGGKLQIGEVHMK